MKKIILASILVLIGIAIGVSIYDVCWCKNENGLVLYLKFDEGKEGEAAEVGTEVKDYSGNKINGVIKGSPKWVKGVSGLALEFDKGDYIDCGNSESFDITNAITIEAWIKAKDIATAQPDARIVMKGKYVYGITKDERNGSNGIDAYINDNISIRVTDIGLEKWQHIVLTYDKKDMKLYVNGCLKGYRSYHKPISISSDHLYIGGDGGQFFHGLIDDVKIYRRALSVNEILNSFEPSAIGKVEIFNEPRKIRLIYYFYALLILAVFYIVLFKTFKYFEKDLIYLILINIYVIIFTLQINLRPFERYPEWDHFWVDVRTASMLLSLKHAFSNFELPVISPYIGFGWNLAGDHQSFWALPNLFIMMLPPATVIIIRQIIYLILGGIGSYLFLKLLTRNKLISFLGALTFISIPYVISISYYFSVSYDFYVIPIFLVLIHKILEQKTIKKLIFFVLYSAFAIGSGDIYFFFIFPVVIFVYTLYIGYGYYRLGFLMSLKKASILLFIAILSGSFYIFPLYNNLHENSLAWGPIKNAVLDKVR